MLASSDRIFISTRPPLEPVVSAVRRSYAALRQIGTGCASPCVGSRADTAASAWPAPFHVCRCCGFPSHIKAPRLTMRVSITDSSGIVSRSDIRAINIRFIYRGGGVACGQFSLFIYAQDVGRVMPGQEVVTGRSGNAVPNVSPMYAQV